MFVCWFQVRYFIVHILPEHYRVLLTPITKKLVIVEYRENCCHICITFTCTLFPIPNTQAVSPLFSHACPEPCWTLWPLCCYVVGYIMTTQRLNNGTNMAGVGGRSAMFTSDTLSTVITMLWVFRSPMCAWHW